MPNEGAIINPQNVPDILDSHRNDLVANVDIRVHEVPKEMRNWDAQSILADYNAPIFAGSVNKKIEFNGHPALLIERDYDEDVVGDDGFVIAPASSMGKISILMTDDIVANIDVVVRPDSHIHAWDVIKKFNISPTSGESETTYQENTSNVL